MRFFFYGTLMDADLTARVLGRRLAPGALRPARLCGWRRAAAHAAAYPILLRCRGGDTAGRVLDRVSPAEGARLACYEGPGYRVRRGVAVLAGRRVGVRLFVPLPGAYRVAAGGWSLARWRRRAKPAALAALTAPELAK